MNNYYSIKTWNLILLAATFVIHLAASLAIHAQTLTPPPAIFMKKPWN